MKSSSVKTVCETMEMESTYEQIILHNDTYDTLGLQKQNRRQDKEKAQKYKGKSCLLGMTVILGLICVVLLLFITLQHISITAERDLYKNTVEELNHTISSLQHNYTDLTLKTPKVEIGWFFTAAMNWSASRQYCRDHGADLVVIKSEVKQRFLSSLVQTRMWIGLSDIEIEGNMKWVDNSTSIQGFWCAGEPNDDFGKEDCVEMMFPCASALNTWNNWNDVPCSEKKKGICEK